MKHRFSTARCILISVLSVVAVLAILFYALLEDYGEGTITLRLSYGVIYGILMGVSLWVSILYHYLERRDNKGEDNLKKKEKEKDRNRE